MEAGFLFLSFIFWICWNIGNSNVSELGCGFVLFSDRGAGGKRGQVVKEFVLSNRGAEKTLENPLD